MLAELITGWKLFRRNMQRSSEGNISSTLKGVQAMVAVLAALQLPETMRIWWGAYMECWGKQRTPEDGNG